MDPKLIITGILKTVGKYSLKGIAFGAELAGRGVVNGANALVSNHTVQKIATGAGLIAAAVFIPHVGAVVAYGLVGKLLYDRFFQRSEFKRDHTHTLDSINDILEFSNGPMEAACNVASRGLEAADRRIVQMGRTTQQTIDNLFR